MDMFYNPKGVGDVLIIPFHQGDRNNIHVDRVKDVAKITEKESGKLLGINIFQASKYIPLAETGKISITEELLDKLQNTLYENGLDETLDIDLSPKFVVGFVMDKQPHENADKLSVCQVDVGEEKLQIVCGAPNIDKNQKVVVAKVGAVMPSGLEIKPTALRGVDSNGMICSKKELGLPDASEKKGIYVLDDNYQAGQPFNF